MGGRRVGGPSRWLLAPRPHIEGGVLALDISQHAERALNLG